MFTLASGARSSIESYCVGPRLIARRFNSGASGALFHCQSSGFRRDGASTGGRVMTLRTRPKGEEGVAAAVAASPAEDQDRTGLRPVQRAKIASQQVALTLWNEDKTKNLTIKDMANRDEIQRLCGAAHWELEVVQRWLSEVDPRDPNKKRGRRKGS